MNPENDSPAYVDPKIDLDLEMANLNVGMTNTQFTTLLQLGDAMNRMQLGRPYRQYRPFNIRECGKVYCTAKVKVINHFEYVYVLLSLQGPCQGMVAICNHLCDGRRKATQQRMELGTHERASRALQQVH